MSSVPLTFLLSLHFCHRQICITVSTVTLMNSSLYHTDFHVLCNDFMWSPMNTVSINQA